MTPSLPAPRPAWLARLNRSGWRGLLAGSVLLTVALLLLAWWVTWQRLDAEQALVRRNARAQQETLAAVIAENLSQFLDRGRLIAIAANEWFEGRPADAAQRLAAMRASDRGFLRIALYDRRLRRVYASSPANDGAPLLDALRSTLAAPPAPAALRLAPLPASDEQAWQLPLLFPVIGQGDEMHGLLLVTIDLGYFLGVYRHLDIGRSGVIQILKDDREELVEARPEGLRVVRQQSSSGATFDDSRRYLTSYRPLDHYPFIVAISRETDETLAEHAGSRSRFLSVLAGLSALILLAGYWVARSIRHQGRLFSALASADREKYALIGQLETEKQRAFDLAAHDPLTGLPNRRMFHELVSSHLSRAKRSRKHYALLYLDLDRFKSINDTLGHHVGDLLLQTVAARLRGALRESDVIARLGGDEFALLLTGLDHINDTATIADKLIEQVGRPCTNLDGNTIQVSPSIGIALFPRDGHDFETLCRHADAAMYQSKRAGRSRHTFYDPSLNPADDRLLNLEQRLPRAIAGNELVLHFQPKVRLDDYRIVGLEVLVRWQHPELGLVYPKDFIPLAERSGYIADIGEWVIAASCRQLADWQAAGLTPLPLAFNISARQLADPGLAQRIAALLAAHGVAGELLEVEVTEKCLLESIETAGPTLRALAELGLRLTLDDFGNGFSNLAHIRSLPFQSLKIDRSFVADIRNGPGNELVIASIIALAHNLRMQVVAEGVELLEQLIHLKTSNCDIVQGYYLSRPVPADAAPAFLLDPILNPV